MIRRDRGLTLSGKFLLKVPGHERDLLGRHERFDAEVYRLHFAPYPWTHIRGFREVFELLLLQPYYDSHTATEFLKGLCPQVVQRIPEDWDRFRFPNMHWHVCNGQQIARICDGKPARLDRACHAIVALQIALEYSRNEVLRRFDIYEYLELAPAIFALDNVSDVAAAWLKGTVRPSHASGDEKRYADLIENLCPKDGKNEQRQRNSKARLFLSDVADGHALTFDNAELIVSYIGGSWGSPRIVPLPSRKEGGRRKKDGSRRKAARKTEAALRCCDHESEFVKLEKSKYIELQRWIEQVRGQTGR